MQYPPDSDVVRKGTFTTTVVKFDVAVTAGVATLPRLAVVKNCSIIWVPPGNRKQKRRDGRIQLSVPAALPAGDGEPASYAGAKTARVKKPSHEPDQRPYQLCYREESRMVEAKHPDLAEEIVRFLESLPTTISPEILSFRHMYAVDNDSMDSQTFLPIIRDTLTKTGGAKRMGATLRTIAALDHILPKSAERIEAPRLLCRTPPN